VTSSPTSGPGSTVSGSDSPVMPPPPLAMTRIVRQVGVPVARVGEITIVSVPATSATTGSTSPHEVASATVSAASGTRRSEASTKATCTCTESPATYASELFTVRRIPATSPLRASMSTCSCRSWSPSEGSDRTVSRSLSGASTVMRSVARPSGPTRPATPTRSPSRVA
jgi:hypothetical protein